MQANPFAAGAPANAAHPLVLRERFKWLKSEQALLGTFQKNAKESNAWYLGVEQQFWEVVVFTPSKVTHLNLFLPGPRALLHTPCCLSDIFEQVSNRIFGIDPEWRTLQNLPGPGHVDHLGSAREAPAHVAARRAHPRGPAGGGGETEIGMK